jgi:hypothetical protein
MRMSKVSLFDDEARGPGEDPVSAVYARLRDDAQRTRRGTYTWADLLALLGPSFAVRPAPLTTSAFQWRPRPSSRPQELGTGEAGEHARFVRARGYWSHSLPAPIVPRRPKRWPPGFRGAQSSAARWLRASKAVAAPVAARACTSRPHMPRRVSVLGFCLTHKEASVFYMPTAPLAQRGRCAARAPARPADGLAHSAQSSQAPPTVAHPSQSARAVAAAPVATCRAALRALTRALNWVRTLTWALGRARSRSRSARRWRSTPATTCSAWSTRARRSPPSSSRRRTWREAACAA